MKLELFFNFDGNCLEALNFYEGVFKTKAGNVMRYSDAPAADGYEVSEKDKDRIMYAGLPIGDMVVMFSDAPDSDEYIIGNNICPTLGLNDEETITRVYNELKEGGEVYMELQKTFFSELFAMVEDQFGIIWQLTLNAG
ncbi:MAG: VOC family protein [Oscillospiraceae bacterium]|jgi:PhnB protein|nr:VOC family protein [Oscillospiraceae bacterium]